MRILLSAFAFSPCRGGEAAVGWNIANELAKMYDVTVLCGDVRGSYRTLKELKTCKSPTLHVSTPRRTHSSSHTASPLTIEYVPPTWFIVFLERMHHIPGLWSLYYWAYNLWQKKAYARARKLHCERPFDLVHQLNMIGYREPGYLWKLPVPFVWGPVGGGPDEPVSFRSLYSFNAKIKVLLRNFLNKIQKRVLLRPRMAAKCAKKIWVVTDADERMVKDIWGMECERMIETAATDSSLGNVRIWDGNGLLHIVWSGTHTYGKALPILIHALAKLKSMDKCNFVVDVLGEGGETIQWKTLSKNLGVSEAFKWHGHLPHDMAIKMMAKCHVLAFPSLKEGTPHVVLEALSLGLPVICHDACGMGTVVTDACGVKIPLKDPQTSIDGFVKAICAMIDNPAIIAQKSAAALARAKELTWTANALKMADVYESIVNNRTV